MVCRSVFAIAMAAWAAVAAAQTPSSEREFDVISKTERDFAAMSLTAGLKKSFLAFAAPDGIIFRPTAVPAVPTLQTDPDDDGGATLDWWPAMGTISRSHDLALSVGPWVLTDPSAPAEARQRFGYYATVWRKQADGSWKFVIDGAGGRIDAEPARAKGVAPKMWAVSHSGPEVTADKALSEVRAAEAVLSAAAEKDARGAIRARLAPDAWLLGSGKEPDGPTVEAELQARRTKMRLIYQGGGASSAGDLVYTYGSVEALDGAPLKNASYIHVWQRQPDGWRIIFEGMKGR